MKLIPTSFRARIILGFSTLILIFMGTMIGVELAGIPGTAIEGSFARQRASVLNDMELVSTLFSQRISIWSTDCRSSLEGLSRSPFLRRTLEATPPAGALELTGELEAFLLSHSPFDSIALIDPESGTVRAEAGKVMNNRSAADTMFTPAQLARLVIPGYSETIDVHASSSNGEHLRLIRQVISPDSPNKVKALLVGQTSLDNAFQALIGTRAALDSRDWELLLASNFSSTTNIIRQYNPHSNSAKYIIDQQNIFPTLGLAISGTEGAYDGPDENGRKVLAFHRQIRINGSIAWGLALRMDHRLALKPAAAALINQVFFWTILMIIGIGICILIARQLSNPVHELIAVAQRIDQGDLTARAVINDQSELLLLSDVFNNMLNRLQHWHQNLELEISERTRELRASEERFRQLNSKLEKRVIERTKALESANSDLESFSYSVSHDLRAPLRAIEGFSQTIEEDCSGKLNAEEKEYLALIRKNAAKMSSLIEDLLRLARMTRTEMRHEPVDLTALAVELSHSIQAQNPQRRVDWRIAPGLRTQGDNALLRIALENLLNNAWKYTGHSEQAIIEFSRTKSGEPPAFVVRDNGAGFNMEYSSRLFSPFQRMHSSQDFPGTGIGLAIVQRIISRHRGRIWAEATVNQGAAFFFTLADSDNA
ncbi:MAG: ATP-binding protein [bacterium]